MYSVSVRDAATTAVAAAERSADRAAGDSNAEVGNTDEYSVVGDGRSASTAENATFEKAAAEKAAGGGSGAVSEVVAESRAASEKTDKHLCEGGTMLVRVVGSRLFIRRFRRFLQNSAYSS